MVTLALFAMVGLMGLAVDFGWAFFVRQSAQRAADAAALAAIKASFATVNQAGPFACTSNPCPNNAPCMVCQATPQNCGSGGIVAGSNLHNGCQYAAQNGFTHAGRQSVRLMSDITTPFNTRTGPVAVHYWVTSVVSETVPQLFSAILGNGTATVAATATAAIVDIQVPGSLILTNHRHDRTAMSQVPGGQYQRGVNLLVQANDNQGLSALQTAAGIYMASDCGPNTPSNSTTCSNEGNQSFYAGENQGGGTVTAAMTRIRAQGWYHNQGGANWVAAPTNGHSSGFGDPMAGKGQPPPKLPSQSWSSQTEYPVPNGVINPTYCETISGVQGQCPPGRYFSVINDPCGPNCYALRADGGKLQIQGDIRFTSGPSGFGNYVFYGGMQKGSGGSASVWFEPAIYVFAGVLPGQNAPGVLLDTSTNFTMRDGSTGIGQNSDAGMLMIMTNGSYTDAEGNAQIPAPVHPAWASRAPSLASQLQFGTVELQAGNNGTYINLHGLNPNHATIQGSVLDTFAPTLLWWDQSNATVDHDIDGNVVCTDVAQDLCTDRTAASVPPLHNPQSAELRFQASPSVHLYGTVYQPRGAWTTLIGGSGYSGPLQLITGALQVKANSNVNLVVPENVMNMTIVTLIQ